jgi:hypothetical protein
MIDDEKFAADCEGLDSMYVAGVLLQQLWGEVKALGAEVASLKAKVPVPAERDGYDD